MSFYKGKIAEDRAISYLKRKGFIIIDRNFYTKEGEIDIIATREGVIHFIEVKSGKGFEPIYNITPSKLKKIIKSIKYYLHKRKLDLNYSIDALIIKDDEVEFIENITL